MKLHGKVGIVTGAGTGIGRACARRFAGEGAKLALFDVSDNALRETKEMILAENPDAGILCLNVDVADEAAVMRGVEEAAGAFGRLDFAHNNAGVMMTPAPVGEVDSAKWERVMRVNLFGAFYCSKYEIQQMLRFGNGGSIVFTASVGGLIGTPGASDYVCSKHAVIGLMKSIMCDYADRGIRSNAICPGQIETPMWDAINGSKFSTPGDYARFNASQNPMRRLGLPEEIAAAALFLVSDEASHITGVALPVDGGHVATNATYFDWS